MKDVLRGVFTALITPFHESGQLDEEGLRHNIRLQIESKVDGLVPLGSTGEAPTLSHAEQERVIEIVLEENAGSLPVVVGTGSYSTTQTIENTKVAEKMGAQMAMVVTPYYNKPTQEGIYRHFIAVAEATTLPIVIYNIQGRTGQNIQTETLKRLAEHPRIVAVKEASGSMNQVSDVIEVVVSMRPDFRVLSGDDLNTLTLMALGGHGVISVASNMIPKQVKELVTALEEADFERGRQMHYLLMPLFRSLFIETNPMPLKAAMNYVGMPAGPCRLPLCDLLPENLNKLKAVLEEYMDLVDVERQLLFKLRK